MYGQGVDPGGLEMPMEITQVDSSHAGGSRQLLRDSSQLSLAALPPPDQVAALLARLIERDGLNGVLTELFRTVSPQKVLAAATDEPFLPPSLPPTFSASTW
eukprot:CAMPEP_0119318164 /NCGR_PEP_ID=MMETSP1333-20130426/45623_1 /TAXON_ID=418940 /ORGANISM="Scyphosphaera apsteinii, Strain RCC1455" /LENGTH=101 /DNA_ID=CAMNT_0007324291 /DNA_START=93 /DNA_END=395 /DNA_ORIENTATION=+